MAVCVRVYTCVSESRGMYGHVNVGLNHRRVSVFVCAQLCMSPEACVWAHVCLDVCDQCQQAGCVGIQQRVPETV